jgi:hypothetical protein
MSVSHTASSELCGGEADVWVIACRCAKIFDHITKYFWKSSLFLYFFYILLTVHQVVIPGKWSTWRTNSFLRIYFIYNSLHVSSTSCSSSGETNCINTTSGVTLCEWPSRLQVGSLHPTCTRHGHQHRVTVTRGCIDTIYLSWWAWGARNMQSYK